MTLLDLLKLLRRYVVFVVVVTIVCTGAGYAVAHMRQTVTISATSSINGVGGGTIVGVANRVIEDLGYGSGAGKGKATNEPVSVTAEFDAKDFVVNITATGADGDACVIAANQVLDETVMAAEKVYASETYDAGGNRHEVKPRYDTTYAIEASETANSNTKKYMVIGLLGGLFLAIFIIVAMASFKGTIIGTDELEEKLGVRRFGKTKEALAVDIKLTQGDAENVLVIPLAPKTDVQVLKNLCNWEGMEDAPQANVTVVESLVDNPKGALQAAKADAVIFAAEPFKSTYKQLDETLRQLDIANANVTGFFEV